MLGKVTFDDHVNGLEMCWKGDISYTFTKRLSFQNLGSGLISPSGLFKAVCGISLQQTTK